MARYIDLDKLLEYEYMECLTISDCREVKKLGIEYCIKHCSIRDECFLFWANDNIEDVAPVIHSSWRTLHKYSKCNNCGQRSAKQSNCCPNCMAKMDKE